MAFLESNLPNRNKSIKVIHAGGQDQSSLEPWSHFWNFGEILLTPSFFGVLIIPLARGLLNFTIRDMALNVSHLKRNYTWIQVSLKASVTSHHLFWECWKDGGGTLGQVEPRGGAGGEVFLHHHFTEGWPDSSPVTLKGLVQHIFIV